MQRILLIGKKGQLGWELQRTLATLGEVDAFDFPEIDLGKPEILHELIQRISPGLIVNAAAYTNVDKAESETELARMINAVAPGVMAEEARRLNAAFIHYSTDYVFDGQKGSPYIEADLPDPINVYGKSKLEGEQRVQSAGGAYLILRTSWVYSMGQGGFVTKVLKWARTQKTLRIVDDQIGSPTSARMLAEATSQVIAQASGNVFNYLQEKQGLYHLGGLGSASRYEWTKEIIDLDPNKAEQTVTELLPAKTSDFPLPAKRPLFTGLDCQKFINTFAVAFPDWRKALRLTMGIE
jgi:dTDP-4-dehydrorhamnose reductase